MTTHQDVIERGDAITISPAPPSGPLVLVIEDSITQRLFARGAIERWGFRVEEAEDGMSGLDAFARLRPDLVLLDVVMPGIDGYETCKRLRGLANGANTPVLMVTTKTDSTSIEYAYECGATDFIAKPIDWVVLGPRLRYMMRTAQLMADMDRSNEGLKQINQRLSETQNQLLQSEKMASIGLLAAGVAHEINNPIGFVNSNLGSLEKYASELMQLLEAYEASEAAPGHDSVAAAQVQALRRKIDIDFLREDMSQLLKESKDGLERVKCIVQDLKDFSRIGESEWQLADLHQCLDSTLNVVANEIKYKAEVVKEYGSLPEVECIASQLNQVFMNLLVNAAQAIPERGQIAIRTICERNWVIVSVADTGTGIDPEHVKRIFDPFFTTKPVGKGTGLGLSVSYSIVTRHNGRIEVDSYQNGGSTFSVWLPVRQSDGAAATLTA
jgi:two-component system NtrC family sensor kinase